MAAEVTANFDIQEKLLPALIDAHANLAPRRRLIADLTSRRNQCLSFDLNFSPVPILISLFVFRPPLCSLIPSDVDDLLACVVKVEELASKLAEGRAVHSHLRQDYVQLRNATPRVSLLIRLFMFPCLVCRLYRFTHSLH